MSREIGDPGKPHFHIRWTQEERLERENFETREQAIARALEVAAIGQRFAVEELSESCPLCGAKDISIN